MSQKLFEDWNAHIEVAASATTPADDVISFRSRTLGRDVRSRRAVARPPARRPAVRRGRSLCRDQARGGARLHRRQARRPRLGRRGLHDEPVSELRRPRRSRGACRRSRPGARGHQQERQRLHAARRRGHEDDRRLARRGARRRSGRRPAVVHGRHRASPCRWTKVRAAVTGVLGEAPSRRPRRRRARRSSRHPTEGRRSAPCGDGRRRRLRHGQGSRNDRAEHGYDAGLLLHERRRRR